MTNYRIYPSNLRGKIIPPPSKSIAHRLIISSALANGTSTLENISLSKDIIATIDAMRELGAEIIINGTTLTVQGTAFPPKRVEIDCCESGSTLRFLIPIACALGVKAVFKGEGKLPQRPITPYLEQLTKKGIAFDYTGTMPFAVVGELESGDFEISGSISSQFITGLLFALPLLDGDSRIILTSKLESKPYVDITIACLKRFGVKVSETDYGYFVEGGQSYSPTACICEPDFSQASFFYVANALGSSLRIVGMNEKSSQGDKKIIEILSEIGYNEKSGNTYRLKSFSVDVSDIPDLVPILAVLASFCDGKSVIFNASRLRIKESDRLDAVTKMLNSLGGNVTEFEDKLEITGVARLSGGVVDSFNDHRIAMATAIASTRCDGEVIIKGADCVSKSYPNFFADFNKLGGKADVIILEE